MISDLFPPAAPAIPAAERALAIALMRRFAADPPSQEPFEWAIENIHFNEPQVKGPFDPAGRHYMRELINNFNEDDCHIQTVCWGTGNGKTIVIMVGTAFLMFFNPVRGLWVLPGKEGAGGARQYNNTRFTPLLRRSPCFAPLLPADRHKLTGLQINLAGNIIDFVGSNSPAQIGSNRCGLVNQDEADKFKSFLQREAGASYLADERTKNVPHAKRNHMSTPTTAQGIIWPDLMASDLRRRFLPCPHCNPNPPSTLNPQPSTDFRGWFVLVKDRQYTVLPAKLANLTPIPLAEMRWDPEAKRADGTWDITRLINSTRFECPWCAGHIRDEHRLWLDEQGQWVPTQSALYHRGYHLPSFYAPQIPGDFATTWGAMAKKFHDAKISGSMKGFINSDLAEVDNAQEHASSTITVASIPFGRKEWVAQMTVDVQQKWPYLWFVIRKWSPYKLHPLIPLVDGQPPGLDQIAGNPWLKERCEKIIAGHIPAWKPLLEILRFDPCTGEFPALDWLLAQQLTGPKLVKLYRDTVLSDSLEFARAIFRAMGERVPRGGDSELIAAGHCETDDWSELHDLCEKFSVGKGFTFPRSAVLIDSGYAEKDNPEVRRRCFETFVKKGWCDPRGPNPPFHHGPKPGITKLCALGNFVPYKGFSETHTWTINGVKGHHLAYMAFDPYAGDANAHQVVVRTLCAAADWYWRRLHARRARQTEKDLAAGGNTWTISPHAEFIGRLGLFEDYKKHLSHRFLDEATGLVCNVGSKPGKRAGGRQSQLYPDHLNDCEKMQEILAEAHGFFSYEK